MRKWRNNPDFPDSLSWHGLAMYLARHLHAGDVVELTGGEPGMFYQLDLLLDFCREWGYRVILRTNGLALRVIERQRYKNMIVVLARHDTGEEAFSDLKSRLLAWDLAHDSLPVLAGENDIAIFSGNTHGDPGQHKFARMMCIYPDGTAAPCHAVKDIYPLVSIEDQGCEPWEISPCCSETCPLLLGSWELASLIP
jgi:MoaA/NifB/PqqE/SkfB family radical SAM enzyme